MIWGWVFLAVFAIGVIYISWGLCSLPVEYGPTMWGNMSDEEVAIFVCCIV